MDEYDVGIVILGAFLTIGVYTMAVLTVWLVVAELAPWEGD